MPLSAKAAHEKDRRTSISEMQHRHFATDAETVAHHFAGELHATNPKFDKARFLTACEVES